MVNEVLVSATVARQKELGERCLRTSSGSQARAL